MYNLDLYWRTNKDWFEVIEFGEYKIKDDAPEEAKESFERYLKQLKEHANDI